MKRITFLALIGILPWITAAPADSTDYDLDGIEDGLDNCSEAANPMQDDTDADYCGNVCDADYDQSGVVGFGDFGYWTHHCFGISNYFNPLCDHLEPIGDDSVIGFGDFPVFGMMYSSVPGPSGTTPGTIACP